MKTSVRNNAPSEELEAMLRILRYLLAYYQKLDRKRKSKDTMCV